MKDLPIEKYLRDAASFLHSDGVNNVLLLRAARLMYDLPAELHQSDSAGAPLQSLFAAGSGAPD